MIKQQGRNKYYHLARVAIIGMGLQFFWIFVIGPIYQGRWDRPTPYFLFLVAFLVLILYRSRWFNEFYYSQERDKSFPARIIIASFGLLLLFLYSFLNLIKYRHFPFQNLASSIEMSYHAGLLLLALLALIANLVAYRIDRKNIR